MAPCHFLYSVLFASFWISGGGQYAGCNETVSTIADGSCDPWNNNIECGYDGGDCCECTCSRNRLYPCGFDGFDCLDPSSSTVDSECQNTLGNAPTCSTEYAVHDWVVNDAESARAFTEAVNCTGGTFNVTWKGKVIIDRTIYIAEGTIVHLTGADSGSEVDGGGSIRVFSLVNASLHVVGMILSNGNATYGGAIAATGSNVTLDKTTFIDNIASSVAGAVYMENSLLIAWGGQATFARNSAGLRGGALVAARVSDISWSGPTSFFDNTAFYYGGAACIYNSIVSWSAETSFASNSVDHYFGVGGALVVDEGSNISWSAETSFVNNSAGSGGSLYIGDNSRVSWSEGTSFFNNSGNFGGAVYIYGNSDLFWSAETSFIDNNAAAGSGGALYVDDGCSVWWDGATSFIDNVANSSGGALFIYNDCSIMWTAKTSFNNNIADIHGGAIVVANGSNVFWSANTSVFSNVAGDLGGGLYIDGGSNVSWSAETSFVNNSGSWGGALFVWGGSDAYWTVGTSFINNSAVAGSGGALYVDDGCNIWWDGATSFIDNVANSSGGALFVYNDCSIMWTAKTSFNNNIADIHGGAIVVANGSNVFWSANTSVFSNVAGDLGGGLYIDSGSNVSWSAETSFVNNSGSWGGALFVWGGSDAYWTVETSFINNSAVAGSGGALYVDDGCNIWWDGATSFIDNVANSSGGALFVYNDCSITWTAKTSFNNNIADIHGGAIVVANGSSTSWEAPTIFFNNSGSLYWGGAILLYENSGLFWGSTTLFASNTAGALGGALASLFGSTVTIAGHSIFRENVAGLDGGAAYIYHSDDQGQSVLIINSTTVFRHNSCDANGGGIALIGSVSTALATLSTSFSGNVAGVAGGAVYVSGVVFGPRLVGTRFVSNSAEMDGGVYATGSGIAVVPNILGVPEPQDPFTFISCEFIENKASTRGGALDSGAGIDLIVNTLFVGNTARTGGGSRLAGEATLDGCTFVENSSDEDKGPAVYNEGLISNMSNCRFVDNVFNCESKQFVVFDESDISLDTVCKDCDVKCENCDFEGKKPMCVDEFDHSSSGGGNTTLELLSIERGYWRVSNTSTKILDCYNADACKGGVTGAPKYCLEGYKGPYCSVCSDGYTPSLGSSCSRCSDTSDLGITLIVVLGVVAFVICVAILNYMLSGQEQSADRGIVACISRFIPLQSLKIIVVVWQILTQFCTVANFSFPSIYQGFLDGVDLLNFDFSWVISTGCILDIDFHDRLLISTFGPIVGMIILGATYTVAINRHRGSEAVRHIVRSRHLSMVLLLTFLVYSSVSTTVFTMFVCDELDDGTSYLRVDYRINCDSSSHRALQIYAGFMVVLYAVGIPAFYAFLLFSNRDTLRKDENRENNGSVASFADLWKPYKPRYFFYEVVECCRRVLLTGVVVFIYQDSAAQIAVALIMATSFLIFSEALAPNKSAWDSLVSRMGHAIVVTSMFLALLLKVDVSDEGAKSQKVFEAVLITVHVAMILVVIVEAGVMIVAWKKEVVREDPAPRFSRRMGVESFTEETPYYDR